MTPATVAAYRAAGQHLHHLAAYWPLVAAAIGVVVGCWLLHRLEQRGRIRHGIRYLELYANRAAIRGISDDHHKPRKED